MNESGILAQNIEVLVYGQFKDKFMEYANVNNSSQIKYATLAKAEKKYEQTQSSYKTEDLKKLQASYGSKLNKLHGLFDDGHKESKDKKNVKDKQEVSNQNYFTWGDFKKTTVTISTKNFWINVNFSLISDMFLDPYVNNVISGNINLLIITFDATEIESCKKALLLFHKLETDKPPSSIKYQSQRLLLQQSYYHSYNDNIVLALCEMPNIGPLGKCLLVGFGNEKEEGKIKSLAKELKIDEEPNILLIGDGNSQNLSNSISNLYDWILESHQKMKTSLNLNSNQKKEISSAIKERFLDKQNESKKMCKIF